MKLTDSNKIITILRDYKASDTQSKPANAVLVPFTETDEGICLLFELRSENIIQAGDVCFPGGRVENGESFKQAAIRECCEELGLSENNIDLIGSLDILINHAVEIHPFSAWIDYEKIKEIRLNKNEVSDYFLVPLEWLIENKPSLFELKVGPVNLENFPYEQSGIDKNYKWRISTNTTYIWPSFNGHVIWGLTAIITEKVLRIINK